MLLVLDDHVQLAAVLDIAALPAAVRAQEGLEGLGEVGRVQGDEAHAALLYAIDDPLDVLVGDLAVALVSPPDEHVGLVERFGRNALLGIGERGRDDLPAFVLERLEPFGHGAVDVVRIDVSWGQSPQTRPRHDASAGRQTRDGW